MIGLHINLWCFIYQKICFRVISCTSDVSFSATCNFWIKYLVRRRQIFPLWSNWCYFTTNREISWYIMINNMVLLKKKWTSQIERFFARRNVYTVFCYQMSSSPQITKNISIYSWLAQEKMSGAKEVAQRSFVEIFVPSWHTVHISLKVWI